MPIVHPTRLQQEARLIRAKLTQALTESKPITLETLAAYVCKLAQINEDLCNFVDHECQNHNVRLSMRNIRP